MKSIVEIDVSQEDKTQSGVGLVVECIVAIDATRVRFPDTATFLLFVQLIQITGEYLLGLLDKTFSSVKTLADDHSTKLF